ncbi:MAG: ABC transporter ATP-binding protein [Candidatus Sumerlaeia bacterium]
MSRDAIIEIEGLGKRYRLGESVDMTRNFRETLMSLPGYFKRKAAEKLARARAAEGGAGAGGAAAENGESPAYLWALRDINLNIAEGDVVGIIGRNGAGKSTMLKILSRITQPTTGRAKIHGRLSALLEVGTGFHPELTGRENIFLNGAILGMRKAEIERKFDEIVAFAETEKFLDTPVKRYSSGMRVRLAFAVAAHLEPEVLVVDEVIAVGDFEFQNKSVRRMQQLAQEGRTVLFVSHNLAILRHFCRTGVLLEKGRIVHTGPIDDTIDHYLARSHVAQHHDIDLRKPLDNRSAGSPPFFTAFRVFGNGRPSTISTMGGSLDFELDYDYPRPVDGLRVNIIVRDINEQVVVQFSPSQQCPEKLVGSPTRGTIRCRVPWLNLIAGTYRVEINAGDNEKDIDRIPEVCEITLAEHDVFGTGKALSRIHGMVYLPCEWQTSWEKSAAPSAR